MQLDRPDQAAKLLTEYLVAEPDDSLALSLLALCCSDMEHHDDATANAQRAVVAGPDSPFAHFVLGGVQLERGRIGDAQRAARESIRLDPDIADGFGLLARTHLARQEWKLALQAADEGLGIDPEDEDCTNARAMALRQMGQRDEAARALQGQLARTPESAPAHANQGWNCLHGGDHAAALEHFREALRLDPTLDWARAGVMETLKARHWFYRPVLRYFMWMSRLQARWQFAVIFGGWLLYRGVSALAREGGPFAPVLWGFVVLYLLFALTTWFASPLANALLVLHPVGRLALQPGERRESMAISGLLALGVALVVVGLAQGSMLLGVGFVLLVTCMPLCFFSQMEVGKARAGMAGYTALVALVGVGWLLAESSVNARRDVLRPWITEAEQLLDEQTALQAVSEKNSADYLARAQDWEARNSAFEENWKQEGLEQELNDLRSADTFSGNLILVFAILGAWVSQLVGVSLSRWGERK